MPVPLPAPDATDLRPPSAEEAQLTATGIAALVRPPGGLTELQRLLLIALFQSLTGHEVLIGGDEQREPCEVAEVLAARNLAFRTRCVQVSLLGALVLRPLPPDVVARVSELASELGVDDQMVPVARRFAEGSLGLAAIDFTRNGYTSTWSAADAKELHVSRVLDDAWETAVDDPVLAARWEGLGDLPGGTLGRGVWELYRARGFAFPGQPGSAPPLLAQHDWVHVLAGYGTTVECELEVFGFIARANDDPAGFSLLAMVVSLFETGYLRAGAGLFESDTGHLSRTGVVERLAEAMARGARCRDVVTGSESIDFLRLDWFSVADLPLDDARARFSVTPVSAQARAAGSVGPWERGGISPFQLASGQAAAERAGRPYDAHGATPA